MIVRLLGGPLDGEELLLGQARTLMYLRAAETEDNSWATFTLNTKVRDNHKKAYLVYQRISKSRWSFIGYKLPGKVEIQ